MEGRPATRGGRGGRGGGGGGGTHTWRRGGGSGGNEGPGGGGRGRGGGGGHHHRGRGKRDHYRGRGRGGGGGAPPHAGQQHRGPDEGNDGWLEDDGIEETFSRRKLESNWDRYAESEREEASDDSPTQRGTDYHVLLESAGDSFTQFRFSEEKDWEMDSLVASQMSAVFLDLPALAQSLQEMPLHQRLNLEAELVQVSTPVELPILTMMPPKQDLGMADSFTPPASAFKRLNTGKGVSQLTSSVSGPSPPESRKAAEQPMDDGDEELDQLLGLQKPLSVSSGAQPVDEETSAPDGVDTETRASPPLSHSQQRAAEPEEVVETVPEEKIEEVAPPSKAAPEEMMEEVAAPPSKAAPEEKMEEVAPPSKAVETVQEEKMEAVAPPSKAAPVKQEMTEDDLEDWLDSMIS